MDRRRFMGWLGLCMSAAGLGFLDSSAEETRQDVYRPQLGNMSASGPRGVRMSGRACRDYRLISDDRSLILDKSFFDA